MTSVEESSNSLRIVHLIPYLVRGGAELQLVQLVEQQRRTGHQPSVTCLSISAEMAGRLKRCGVPVTVAVSSGVRARWRWCRRVRAAMRAADVVHSWMYHAFLISAALRPRFGDRPTHVWAIRRTDPASSGLSARTRLVARMGAVISKREANGLLFCSAAAGERHRKYGYQADATAVVGNAVDASFFSGEKIDDSGGASLRCGSLTRWSDDKGIDVLIAAWPSVVDRVPEARLVLAGPGMAADNAELVDLLERSGVSHTVVLQGATDDPAGFHRTLDVLVSPSRTEGFPNVVAEAMAVGTAVVATDVGGTDEVLGGAGLLVPSEDPKALADAIVRLAESSGERALFADIGRSRATAAFSIQSTAQATMNLYELSAVAQARRSRRFRLRRPS